MTFNMNFEWRTLIYFKHQSFIAKIGRLLENLDQIWFWNSFNIFQIIGKNLFPKQTQNLTTKNFFYETNSLKKRYLHRFVSSIFYVNCLSLTVVSEVECGCESEGVSCLSTSKFRHQFASKVQRCLLSKNKWTLGSNIITCVKKHSKFTPNLIWSSVTCFTKFWENNLTYIENKWKLAFQSTKR